MAKREFAQRHASDVKSMIKDSDRDESGRMIMGSNSKPRKQFFTVPDRTSGKTVVLRFVNDFVRLWYHDFRKTITIDDQKYNPTKHINRGFPLPCSESWGEKCSICEALKQHDHLNDEPDDSPMLLQKQTWFRLHGRFGPTGQENDEWCVKVFNVIDIKELDRLDKEGIYPGDADGPEIKLFRATRSQFMRLAELSDHWGELVWDPNHGVDLLAKKIKPNTGGNIDVVEFSIKDAVIRAGKDGEEYDVSEAKAQDNSVPDDWYWMDGLWLNDPDLSEEDEVKKIVETHEYQNSPQAVDRMADQLSEVLSGKSNRRASSYSDDDREFNDAESRVDRSRSARTPSDEEPPFETDEPDEGEPRRQAGRRGSPRRSGSERATAGRNADPDDREEPRSRRRDDDQDEAEEPRSRSRGRRAGNDEESSSRSRDEAPWDRGRPGRERRLENLP